MATDFHTCTKDDPWTKEKGERAAHPDAKDVGECSDGCCDYWLCPHCGLRFKTTVAD